MVSVLLSFCSPCALLVFDQTSGSCSNGFLNLFRVPDRRKRLMFKWFRCFFRVFRIQIRTLFKWSQLFLLHNLGMFPWFCCCVFLLNSFFFLLRVVPVLLCIWSKEATCPNRFVHVFVFLIERRLHARMGSIVCCVFLFKPRRRVQFVSLFFFVPDRTRA